MAYQADVSNLEFKLTIYSIVAGFALTFGGAYVLGHFLTGHYFSNFLNLSIWMLLNCAVFVIFIISAGLLAISAKTLAILFMIDYALVFLSSNIYPDGQEGVAAFYTPIIISISYCFVVRRKIPAPNVET